MIKTKGIYLILLLSLFSCKKDEFPEDNKGEVAFQSEFTFDNDSYSLAAGIDNLVMQPSFQESDSAIIFTTSLSSPDCLECGPALEVIIESPSLIPDAVSDWIAELNSWNYGISEIFEEADNALRLNLNPGNDFSMGYWQINEEIINNIPQNNIEVDLEESGTYSLRFSNDGSFCEDGPDRSIFFNGEDLPCYVNLEANPVSPFEPFDVIATPGGGVDTTSLEYTWFYNGQTIGPIAQNSFFVDSIPGSSLDICVSYFDDADCAGDLCYVVAGIGGCYTNVNIAASELVPTEPVFFDGAIFKLRFTDPNGIIYRSNPNLVDQGTLSLMNVEPYQEPTQPHSSYAKMIFQAKMILYNDQNEPKNFSGLIEIAVALP